jgi:molybdopterin-containing oxidoreductase family membrane subunit
MSYEDKLANCTEDERVLLKPLVRTTRTFYLFFGLMVILFLGGIVAYIVQYRYGLGVTGLNEPSYWGIYIIDFVFFIGISHAGTLISAILRISKAEWRRSITRSAEFITVLVIGFGAIQPVLDLGRPDRVLNVLYNGHLRSPLLWDVLSIGLYFTASSIYLYVPMIPDLARLRDLRIKLPWLYRILALGYKGTPAQEKLLERIIMVLAVMVIPVAISVHTVIGWIFALTLRPGWHSTIFGPYFVMGAIYSGIAALLIAMAILRKVYGFQNYFKDIHFNNMGILLLVMSLLWFYFTFAEYITVFYGQEVAEMRAFWDKFTGTYAPFFWLMVASCFVVPFTLMCRKKTRTVRGTVIASSFVVLGKLYHHGSYLPSLVEILIMLGTFAGFIMVYMVATKLFPIISIWEIKEGKERSVDEVAERVAGYLPDEGVEEALT